MSAGIGDAIPQATFKTMSDDGPANITTDEIFKGKTVVLIGVPGAFTPTCHHNHLPGFLEHLDSFKAKGVDEIAIVSVNDVWVMGEWAKASRGQGKILYLSDGSAEFAKAAGLDADLSIAGMGVRLKRFSMLVEDGVIKQLNTGDAPGHAEISGAATLLEQL